MDLSILDLRMTIMDGIELVRIVKKNRIETPIIIISGASDRTDLINLLNLGAYSFVEKPIMREHFINQVRNGLHETYLQFNIAQLTQLNFRAYLAGNKLAHTRDEKTKPKMELELRNILDKIVEIQNQLLEPNFIEIKL